MNKLFRRKSRMSLDTQKPFGTFTIPATVNEKVSQERPEMWARSEPGKHITQSFKSDASDYQIIRINEVRGLQQAEEERRIQCEQNSTISRIRELRGMIREKRRLDIEIWDGRTVQKDDRKDIMRICTKADGLLDQICAIIESWEENQFSKEEWPVVRRIKEGMKLSLQDYTSWATLPPWDREETEEMYTYGWT